MARARDPNREVAKQLYLESDGKMLLKDIATQLGKSDTQIRKWKNLDKWDGHLKGNVTNESKSNVTNKKQSNHKKTKADVTEELPLIDNDNLTDKQKLFCIYYVKMFNATKAYQKAYECDYEVANKNAYALMVKHGVKEEIMRLKRHRMSGEFFDKYDVLQKYKDIAFADMTEFTTFGTETVKTFNDQGEEVEYEVNRVYFKDSSEIDGTLVTEVKQGKDGVSIKLADKMKALDFLAKYTDLLDDNELKQLKVEKERIVIAKENGVEEEYEDDGFIDALKGTEVNWSES